MQVTRKAAAFDNKLGQLLDISIPDKEQNKDRLAFLQDQRGKRELVLFGFDAEAESRQDHRRKRKSEETARRESESKEKVSRFEAKPWSDSEDQGWIVAQMTSAVVDVVSCSCESAGQLVYGPQIGFLGHRSLPV
jgi:hypothetical protein